MTTASVHEVRQGEQQQTSSETLVWAIDLADVTPAPTSPSVLSVTDLLTGLDVQADVLGPGSPTVSGSVVTLPTLHSLQPGRTYRVRVLWLDGSSQRESYILVRCPL